VPVLDQPRRTVGEAQLGAGGLLHPMPVQGSPLHVSFAQPFAHGVSCVP